MNKKLTAIAVAAVLAAPAAQAAPKVYGRLQAEVAQVDNSAVGVIDRTWVVDNKMGRFGIKGSEDLGGGLKALYLMEFGLETTENVGSSNTLFDREKMVGLKIGKAHTVMAGALKSPYKYMAGVKYDTFVATTLQARAGSSNINSNANGRTGGVMSSGALGHGGFVEDSIGYKGKFGNVLVWGNYSPDETSGDSSKSTALGVQAKMGSFQFGGALMSRASCADDVGTNTGSLCGGGDVRAYDATKLFLSWSKKGHTIRGQFEATETDAGSSTATTDNTVTETDFVYLNYQFKMGKHLIDVAVGEADQQLSGVTVSTAAQSSSDVDWSRVAYAYNFSKKTRVFAGYASRDDKGTTTTSSDNDTDIISLGMTVKF